MNIDLKYYKIIYSIDRATYITGLLRARSKCKAIWRLLTRTQYTRVCWVRACLLV